MINSFDIFDSLDILDRLDTPDRIEIFDTLAQQSHSLTHQFIQS